ncbi:MAG: ATP-binding protein [Planctomycetota bacterium]
MDDCFQLCRLTKRTNLDAQRRNFAERFDRYLALAEIDIDLSVEDCLINLGVARPGRHGLELTNAAVLFFAQQPSRFFPEAGLTCVRYRGTDRYQVLDRRDYTGTPIEIIEQGLEFFMRHSSVETVLEGKARRRELHEYPPTALREIITNAVMHRDYLYDLSHCYAHMFSDRLEVENPGGLCPGITESDLGKRSVRRNPTIANLRLRAKYVEQLGSGLSRIRTALAENGNPPFELGASNFFLIRLLPRLPGRNDHPLSPRQQRLFQMISDRGFATSPECAAWIEASEDTARRDLKKLIDAGYIIREGVGKATTYRPSD